MAQFVGALEYVSQNKHATLKFFQDAFGWGQLNTDTAKEGGPIELQNTGKTFGLIRNANEGEKQATVLYLMSDNIDDTLAKATAEGTNAVVCCPKTEAGEQGWFAYFVVPGGIMFGIWQSKTPEKDQEAKVPGTDNKANILCYSELLSSDIDATLKYFQDVFEWKDWVNPMPGYYQIKGVASLPMGFGLRGLLGSEAPGVLPYVGVESIDEGIVSAKKAGGNIVKEKMPIKGDGWLAHASIAGGIIQGIWQDDINAPAFEMEAPTPQAQVAAPPVANTNAAPVASTTADIPASTASDDKMETEETPSTPPKAKAAAATTPTGRPKRRASEITKSYAETEEGSAEEEEEKVVKPAPKKRKVEKGAAETPTDTRAGASYTVKMNTPPAKVFSAVSTQKGLRGWWAVNVKLAKGTSGVVEFNKKEDGTFERTCKFDVITKKKNKLVEWKFTDSNIGPATPSEWIGTVVSFVLKPADEGKATEVVFTHHGIEPTAGCYDECSKTWEELLNGNLKIYAESEEVDPKFK